MGKKCQNGGILVSAIENMILSEIGKYRDNFLCEIPIEQDYTKYYSDLIKEKEKTLIKLKKALNLINEAYEMGDYDRTEWLERKTKREREIQLLNEEIYYVRKQSNQNEQQTNSQRVENLNNFFENIVILTKNSERNSLYRTIIESIIWYKDGDNISIEIYYK